jgi:hypothetical protein
MAACRSYGGTLMIVRSSAERDYLATVYWATGGLVWIAGTQIAIGNYQWADRTAVSTFWCAGIFSLYIFMQLNKFE